MSSPNYVDLFIVYALLPLIAISGLIANRMYFRSKSDYFQTHHVIQQKFKLSRNLLFGNIFLGILIICINLIMYTYIINIRQFTQIHWEIIAIFFINILTFTFGVGIGAHVTAITLKTTIDPKSLLEKSNQLFKEALNFFHYPFSHKLPYTSMLLIIYILNVLDLYKGKSLELSIYAKISTITAGMSIGIFTAILFILAKTQKLMMRTVIIILVSIYLVNLTRSRNFFQHPLSLMFITIYWTILISLLIQKQTKFDLHTPAKKLIKKWFNWDIDIM